MTEDQLNGMHAMIGCIEAMHSFCVSVAKSLPEEVAMNAHARLQSASRFAEMNEILSPQNEHKVAEYRRIVEGLSKALEAAVNNK